MPFGLSSGNSLESQRDRLSDALNGYRPDLPMSTTERTRTFPVRDYDLNATFTCGQAFRWQREGKGWIGVIGSRWVRLEGGLTSITAETIEAVKDWRWLADYLQLDLDLDAVVRTFPDDEPIRAAVAACRGLRLLRQDPWECLASFILSSTKQILQIQQIISILCERYGQSLAVPRGHKPLCSFPSAVRLAQASEADLRACKMGFRAPFLLETAHRVADGKFDLRTVQALSLEAARAELMTLPGVGRKIADCVLLFGFGRLHAFPIDVWIAKAFRQLYFRRRSVRLLELQQFASSHFGPNAGFVQQYLFHHARLSLARNVSGS
jgi:N-glycosylase/DNA lyase